MGSTYLANNVVDKPYQTSQHIKDTARKDPGIHNFISKANVFWVSGGVNLVFVSKEYACLPFEEFFWEVLGLGLVGVAVVARTFFLALDLVLRVVGGIFLPRTGRTLSLRWILEPNLWRPDQAEF